MSMHQWVTQWKFYFSEMEVNCIFQFFCDVDKDVGNTFVDAGFVNRLVGPLSCFCVLGGQLIWWSDCSPVS